MQRSTSREIIITAWYHDSLSFLNSPLVIHQFYLIFGISIPGPDGLTPLAGLVFFFCFL
jgi:hypothetical protein